MKAKVWIARDKDGTLCLYEIKPIRKESEGVFTVNLNYLTSYIDIDKDSHSEITWENSPQEIEV